MEERTMLAHFSSLVMFCTILQLDHVQGQEIVEIPICSNDQFLTSNGTDLVCATLPDGGFCDCPDLVPPTDDGEPAPVIPLPPPGCAQFEPPSRGAFVCLRQVRMIYCSVLCDHRFEFFTSPNNPYSCGEDTGFLWEDSTGGRVEELPACTGFRHRLQTLYRDEFYLPAPCNGLTEHTIAVFLNDFHQLLMDKTTCSDCELQDVFLRCPRVQPSATFLANLTNTDNKYH